MKTLNLKFIPQSDLLRSGFTPEQIEKIRMSKYAVAEYESGIGSKKPTVHYPTIHTKIEEVVINKNWVCITDDREEFIEFMG